MELISMYLYDLIGIVYMWNMLWRLEKEDISMKQIYLW